MLLDFNFVGEIWLRKNVFLTLFWDNAQMGHSLFCVVVFCSAKLQQFISASDFSHKDFLLQFYMGRINHSIDVAVNNVKSVLGFLHERISLIDFYFLTRTSVCWMFLY